MATARGSKILAKQVHKFDHRNINNRQKLFFFDGSSKGSAFFLPRGARIFNKLIEFMRNEYKVRNYLEVNTPTNFDVKLWQKSGHWTYYEENMIKLKTTGNEYSIKPMNCPAHCLIYNQMQSYKHELPIRLADFGTLHRNELSGSLTGLMRLRRFHQDDAHIFCRHDQIETEVNECLQFASDVYKRFNLPFSIRLSLRPQEYLGDPETWDVAEEGLRSALRKSQYGFEEQALEGAFYGPKIDIVVRDTMEREHQCATIQLDFQLSKRFNLTYKKNCCDADDELNDSSQELEPVIIHRAILGSVERFMAILAENYNGRWPFWLSPFQAMIIPIHKNYNDYADRVRGQLSEAQFWVEADLSDATFNAKIRQASLMPYNLILVVGEREAQSGAVASRMPSDSNKPAVIISVDKLIGAMKLFEQTAVHRADLALENYNK